MIVNFSEYLFENDILPQKLQEAFNAFRTWCVYVFHPSHSAGISMKDAEAALIRLYIIIENHFPLKTLTPKLHLTKC